jgi:hypothetical protein
MLYFTNFHHFPQLGIRNKQHETLISIQDRNFAGILIDRDQGFPLHRISRARRQRALGETEKCPFGPNTKSNGGLGNRGEVWRSAILNGPNQPWKELATDVEQDWTGLQ